MTTSGPNSAKPTTGEVIAGVYNAAGETLVDGQASPLQLGVDGSLKVAATLTPSGLQNVNIADVSGNPPALTNPLPVELSDGTNAIGVVGNPVIVSATLAAETTKVIGTVRVEGNIGAAFDAPATGTAPANVLYQGDRAAITYPTAATDGQIVAQMADKAGRLVAVANVPRDLVGTSAISNNSGTSAVSFIASGGAGIFTDIITFIITNRSATATVVTLTDGTVSYTFAISASGGLVCNFPTPLIATSSATAWTIGNSAAVACDYIAVYAKNK